MSKLQYAWILATVAMMRRATDTDPDAPWPLRLPSLAIDSIEGIAGRLRTGERRAANDLEAMLFILLLIWVWNCANNRANLVNRGSFLRKLTVGEFSEAVAPQAAWLLALAEFAGFLDQCHSDHLPTLNTLITAPPDGLQSRLSACFRRYGAWSCC